MSTVLESRRIPRAAAPRVAGLAVAAGLALLYLPTYAGLAATLWQDEAYAHGPLILAVSLYLAWRGRAALGAGEAAPLTGGALLLAGLLLWLVGRTQSIALFEVASHLPVLAGVVLVAGGFAALRALAFPVLFLAFLVPLPGFVLDAATTPLRQMVSAGVEQLLLALGYAVDRQGVVLVVNGHEMLVADACSGMNSLVSLLALGLLYLHLTGPRARTHSAVVLASIVPVAIAANMLRVLALVLLTVHAGADVSQGWMHGALGMMVFVVAFAMMVAVDRVMGGRPAAPARAPEGHVAPVRSRAPGLSLLVAAGAIAATAAAAPGLKPLPDPTRSVNLEALVPQSFGGWRLDPESVAVPPAPAVQANLDRLYSQVLERTYVNEAGERMMLTVAYGGDQSDALKAHRQEVCYRAQGFDVHGTSTTRLAVEGRRLPVTRFFAVRPGRAEPVTYWFTLGDRAVLGRGERLAEQLRNGIAGRMPDGMMVRVSSLSGDAGAAYAAQQSFISQLLAGAGSTGAARLAGAA